MPALAPDAIAAAVTASRAEFGDLFLRAQGRANRPPDARRAFEVVAASARAADDRAAFTAAAKDADDDGWSDALVTELIDSDRENGALRMSRLADQPGRTELQAIQSVDRGFIHTELLVRGVTRGQRWTCKVVVNGQDRGTGVLVQPHLVLTAWHVVRELFQRVGGELRPTPAVNPTLHVVFDDFLVERGGGVAAGPPRRVNAHPTDEWCPMFKACHDDELNGCFPADPSAVNGYWDFAFIRLAEPVGLTRGHAVCNASVPVPAPRQPVYVFQHPGPGVPLQVDRNDVFATPDPLRAAVPHYRFLHRASTLPGSSGGPVFDRDFLLCGLHQGTWTGAAAGEVVNRGIPLTRICETIAAALAGLPPLKPQEHPVATLGPAEADAPVVGCDEFQADLWGVAQSGRASILVITGGEGRGKSFRLRLAGAQLPSANHLKVRIDSTRAVARPAADFAEYLCRQAGTALPPVTAPGEANTTDRTWRKDQLAAAVVAALDTTRQGRLVWLLLADLNRCSTFDETTSDLLYLLYERVLTEPWLRVVLDGMQGALPRDLRARAVEHRVEDITEKHIREFLERRLTELNLPVPDATGFTALAGTLHRVYRRAKPADAAIAMAEELTYVLSRFTNPV